MLRIVKNDEAFFDFVILETARGDLAADRGPSKRDVAAPQSLS
jgi:hypothetical protein